MAQKKKSKPGPTRSKKKGQPKANRDRDKKIAAGELRLEEIDLLRLQKLMHQRNSLGQESEKLQAQARTAAQNAREADKLFMETAAQVRAKYGLDQQHDMVLADGPQAGIVFVNQQSQQQAMPTAPPTPKKEKKEKESEEPPPEKASNDVE